HTMSHDVHLLSTPTKHTFPAINPVLLFFFQAEARIRDFHVTGVQTCALPISVLPPRPHQRARPQALHPVAFAIIVPSTDRRVSSDRKSTRLNSSHVKISYAVFCLKKKTTNIKFLFVF